MARNWKNMKRSTQKGAWDFYEACTAVKKHHVVHYPSSNMEVEGQRVNSVNYHNGEGYYVRGDYNVRGMRGRRLPRPGKKRHHGHPWHEVWKFDEWSHVRLEKLRFVSEIKRTVPGDSQKRLVPDSVSERKRSTLYKRRRQLVPRLITSQISIRSSYYNLVRGEAPNYMHSVLPGNWQQLPCC